MKSRRRPPANRVSARAQRLDPRQESRFSLALVLLMSVATLSVMATTTQALSSHDPAISRLIVTQ